MINLKKIKLMPDYGCHALWYFEDKKMGDIDPSTINITNDLIIKLELWALQYSQTFNQDYPPESGFQSDEIKLKFVEEGYQLAICLKKELNDVAVIYFDINKEKNIYI